MIYVSLAYLLASFQNKNINKTSPGMCFLKRYKSIQKLEIQFLFLLFFPDIKGNEISYGLLFEYLLFLHMLFCSFGLCDEMVMRMLCMRELV